MTLFMTLTLIKAAVFSVLFFVLVMKLQVPAHYRRNATTFTRSSNQLKFKLIKSNSLHICLQTAHHISPF